MTILIVCLSIIAIALLFFIFAIVLIAAFIVPRVVGSVKIIDIEGEESLCVVMEDRKDFEKLKKYSYVVVKSKDFNPQK